MNEIIFSIAVLINLFLFAMMCKSLLNADFQYWPPISKKTWQYHSLWWSVRILVVSILYLSYSEHSTIIFPDWLRFFIAMPIFVITFSLGSIAAAQLGWRNTHGEAIEFVQKGFYKYSRNPQYLMYSISFICLGIWVASAKAFLLLILLSIWYLVAPFAEEKWLERKYGQIYTRYKTNTPRFFGSAR